MAYQGGKWTVPEGILPGARINVVAKERAGEILSPRGIAAIPMELNWGADEEIVSFVPKDYTRDSIYKFGYDVGDPELRDIGELFKGASEVLIARLNTGGKKADCPLGTAKWSGTRGNDLTLTVEADPDAGYVENAFSGVKVTFAAEGDTVSATVKNIPESWDLAATLYRNNVEVTKKSVPETVDGAVISRRFPPSATPGEHTLVVSLTRGQSAIPVATGTFNLVINPETHRYVTLTKGAEQEGTAVESAAATFDFAANKAKVTFSDVPEGYTAHTRVKGQVGVLAYVPGKFYEETSGLTHTVTYEPGAPVNGEMTLEAYLCKTGEKTSTVIRSCTYTAKVEGEDKPQEAVATKTGEAAEEFDEQIPGRFIVKTFLEGREVNKQKVKGIYQLKDTDFIVFKRERELEPTAGLPLTGGTNGVTTVGSWSDALARLEPMTFHALGCPTTNEDIQQMFINFTRQMRDEMGVKFQTVMPKTTESPNYEGVIQIENAVTDPDADQETALVYWVTGQEAGCKVQDSVANMAYDGVYTIDTDYTQRDLEAVVEGGYFGFHLARGKDRKQYVKVLLDINTLTEPQKDQDESFKNNQTIRVCDQCCNDIAAIFNNDFFGKVPNNVAGREAFRNKIIEHHTTLETIQAIEDFDPDAVTVERGATKTVVIATDAITPVNAMEQLYMTIVVA